MYWKKSIILLALTIIFVVGCQEKKVVLENAPNTSSYGKVGEDESPPDTSILYVETEGKLLPINTSGISVSNDYLHFSNWDVFENTMKSLANHNDSAMNIWESSFSGFSSLRKYYYDLQQNSNRDDLLLASQRIPDREFETILNESSQVRIGDTLLEYDFANEQVELTDLDSDQTETFDISINTSTSSPTTCPAGDDCHYGQSTSCETIQANDSDNKVYGKKWNTFYLVYSAVGAKTVNFQKNENGKWKREKTYTIYLWLDHYHDTKWHEKWEHQLGGTPHTYSTAAPRRFKMRFNANHVQRLFKRYYGTPDPQVKYCVHEFGLVHHWVDDHFNDDCHNLSW